MLWRKSHFQHNLYHEFRFISKGTIRPLLPKQIAQRPLYPGRMLIIPVLGQKTERTSGSPRPAAIQALLVEKFN